MSMFPIPENAMADLNKDNPFGAFSVDMTEMQKSALAWMKDFNGPGPDEFAGMVHLSAHPMAAMAAASAIGMGMAGQMYGMMMGAMAGAMEQTTRLASDHVPGGSDLPAGYLNPFAFDLPTGTFSDTEAADAVATTGKTAPEVVMEAVGAVAAAPDTPPAETVMPEDFVKPQVMDRPAIPDDLKKIAGVGPKLEQVLNDLGVWTYAQIAAWTPQQVAWVDDYLQFHGRIDRDDWIAQAREMTGQGT